MISHFTRMAFKAMFRFKLHSIISLLSLIFGFICFIAAVLLSNYAASFDQHFSNADRIYFIVSRNVGDSPMPDNFPIINEPASRYLRSYFPEIPNIARATTPQPEDVSYNGRTITLDTKYVEEKFFDIFPMETIYGLPTGDALPPNSVMISEEAAMEVFGRIDVVGERLIIANRSDVSIAGVAKTLEHPSHLNAGFAFFNTELFVPIEIQDQQTRDRIIAAGDDPDADRWGNNSYYVYLEIPEDMAFNVDDFNGQLDEFVQATLPQERKEFQTYALSPINQLVTTTLAFVTGGFDITKVLVVAGALVLMIGCLNYSNLVIAQLSLRSQEIGVQKILGSKRSLLIMQYCYESLLFVGVALVLSLLIFLFLLNSIAGSGLIGFGPSMLINPTLWTAISIVMLVIVGIAGLYPALRTAMVPLVNMMRPKGSAGYSGRLRSIMVGVQFFVSGTLMILAMVMFAQNNAMTQQLDGSTIDPKILISTPVDTFTVDPELLANELKAHPGVLSVTQVSIPPWTISSSSSSYSRSADTNAEEFEIANFSVGYDYSETMGTPLIAGRDFSRERSSDLFPAFSELTSNTGPFAVLIDDQAARSFGWESAEEAIGESIYRNIGPPTLDQETAVELTIVGAVGAQKYQFVDFSNFGVEGNLYLLRPAQANYLIIKASRANLNEALVHIDTTWNRLMPTIGLQREFFDNIFYQTYNIFLAISSAIAILSVIGFLIASIGLLGNATFITNIRQKEVGIRKVMGASSGILLRMLLLDFAKPIIIANAIAWPLGYVLGTGYVSLFAARAEITFTPFLVSLLLSALIACSAVVSQSWKSSRVRPAMVLRYE